MNNTLYIIRGIPGSGKSTLAKKLVGDDNYFEADMYFLQDGIYEFDITKIKDAHDWCYNKIEEKFARNFLN